MQQTNLKVLVLGGWHLGSVNAACIAERGHSVSLWDQNLAVTEAWKDGRPPLFEPGLDLIIRRHWNENLKWATHLQAGLTDADWIVVAYDTPVDSNDEIDLSPIQFGIDKILDLNLGRNTHFFFTSQIPVGTSRKFLSQIKTKFPNWQGSVMYQPENLRLGSAIEALKMPDRVALGFDTEESVIRHLLLAQFREVFGLENTPVDLMSLESAEMVKHAMNSFLASCVVFGNELSVICEKTGADAWDVAKSLKNDTRVGKKAPLFPGLGFAGGTLARDVRILSKRESAAGFFDTIYQANSQRNDWVRESLLSQLSNLNGKNILFLGVTYKAQTSTVRRSPAIEIGNLLVKEGATCFAIDPKADLNELTDSERNSLPFTLLSDWNKAFKGMDAIVLITEWPEFNQLHWKELIKELPNPVIVDTKNLLFKDHPYLQKFLKIPGKQLQLERKTDV